MRKFEPESGGGGVGEQAHDVLAPLPPSATHSLPATPTPLLGRERELAELGELLANPAQRLITITGPGGIRQDALGPGCRRGPGRYIFARRHFCGFDRDQRTRPTAPIDSCRRSTSRCKATKARMRNYSAICMTRNCS